MYVLICWPPRCMLPKSPQFLFVSFQKISGNNSFDVYNCIPVLLVLELHISKMMKYFVHLFSCFSFLMVVQHSVFEIYLYCLYQWFSFFLYFIVGIDHSLLFCGCLLGQIQVFLCCERDAEYSCISVIVDVHYFFWVNSKWNF